MCSLLCNFNCYCTLGASLMLALSAIDVSLHYYYMQNFHRKKKKKKIVRGRMGLRTEKGMTVADNLLHIPSYRALNNIHTER